MNKTIAVILGLLVGFLVLALMIAVIRRRNLSILRNDVSAIQSSDGCKICNTNPGCFATGTVTKRQSGGCLSGETDCGDCANPLPQSIQNSCQGLLKDLENYYNAIYRLNRDLQRGIIYQDSPQSEYGDSNLELTSDAINRFHSYITRTTKEYNKQCKNKSQIVVDRPPIFNMPNFNPRPLPTTQPQP